MKFKLVIGNGAIRGTRYPLERGTFVAGRDRTCEIWLPDQRASRNHASFQYEDDGWFVIDLESTNGTFVNGTAINPGAPHKIQTTDRIQIGDTELKLVEGETSIAHVPPELLDYENTTYSNLVEQVIEFQSKVSPVGKWRTVATLMAEAIQKGLGDPLFMAIMERDGEGRYVPWIPFTHTTTPPLPSEDVVTEIVVGEHPKLLAKNSVLLPFPSFLNQPVLGLFVQGPEMEPPIVEFLRGLVRVASLTPALTEVGGKSNTVSDIEDPQRIMEIIGDSLGIQKVIQNVHRAGSSSVPILILGETGVGKELVARAIHRVSVRASEPFVPVNSAAISPELVESELFGHTKGAFTGATEEHRGYFEQAGRGTLFLDEVGELPLSAQAKLLRVLDSGEVRRVGSLDVLPSESRILCATNRNLENEIKRGNFRLDLFYRIAGLVIRIPPLRERREDISILVEHFLDRIVKQGGNPISFTDEAMQMIIANDWPGNVRELQMFIRRISTLTDGGELGPQDLPWQHRSDSDITGLAGDQEGLTSLAIIEQAHIVKVYEACNRNQSKAAEVLGITRRTLHNKLKLYGLLS